MEREFVQLPEFNKQWTQLGFNDDDLLELEENIKKNPALGKIISGTGGVRKMRFAFEGRGKSGSARVLYIDIFVAEKVLLLGAYAKGTKDTLTQDEKNELRKLTAILKDQYRD